MGKQSGTRKQPNLHLRHEREARGWTQKYVAEKLGADTNIVSRWESGERKPGLYYRQKLSALFGRSPLELGLVDGHAAPEESGELPSLSAEGQVRSIPSHHPLDLLRATNVGSPERQLGAWLALGASDLLQLLEEGWTPNEIFSALQVLQKAVQIVSRITRRRLFELGALALVSGIPIPTGSHISVGERTELHQALSDCIGGGWQLFTTASIPQVLVVGQAQLYLLHQVYAELYPSVRPMFYSPVYRLIGAALFFQSRYPEALQFHNQAYLTALEAGDSWNMAESLSWQAGVYKACGRHAESMQTTEAALRLLNSSREAYMLASQARLLAHWAESAALLGERSLMEEKLSASAELLPSFAGNDEFDIAIWQLYRGMCALYSGDPGGAEQHLERALGELRPNLLHQRASAALLLAQARIKSGEWNGALRAVRIAVPLVVATMSPLLDRGLVDLVEQFMVRLSGDAELKDLVEEVRKHPRLHSLTAQQRVPRYLEATL